ncbi:hypothetical protein N9L68_00440 [bacterium]|nr:hypothetical protein [bacterium]
MYKLKAQPIAKLNVDKDFIDNHQRAVARAAELQRHAEAQTSASSACLIILEGMLDPNQLHSEVNAIVEICATKFNASLTSTSIKVAYDTVGQLVEGLVRFDKPQVQCGPEMDQTEEQQRGNAVAAAQTFHESYSPTEASAIASENFGINKNQLGPHLFHVRDYRAYAASGTADANGNIPRKPRRLSIERSGLADLTLSNETKLKLNTIADFQAQGRPKAKANQASRPRLRSRSASAKSWKPFAGRARSPSVKSVPRSRSSSAKSVKFNDRGKINGEGKGSGNGRGKGNRAGKGGSGNPSRPASAARSRAQTPRSPASGRRRMSGS